MATKTPRKKPDDKKPAARKPAAKSGASKPTAKSGGARKPAAKKKTSKGKAGQGRGRRLAWLAAKLGLVGLALVLSYGIYIDGKISARLQQSLWQLPTQIYARPLVLEVGNWHPIRSVLAELEMLNYRKVADPQQPGEYSASSSRIEVYRRTFDHPDAYLPAQRFMLTFSGNTLKKVENLEQKTSIRGVMLDPLLLERVGNHEQERMLLRLEDTPELLLESLLLVEDRDFYHHDGVKPAAIARAALVNLKAGRTVQGGSTLTQQLVKNVFLSSEQTLVRKFNELFYAVLIDFRWSKDQILEAYLNEIYLGQNGARGVYGFGLASHFYFGKPINEISLSQQALLIALVKGPSFYDPWRNTERAWQRRDLVLQMLAESGVISGREYESAVNMPLGLIKRGEMNATTQPAFMGLVRREMKQSLGSRWSQYSGMRVFTSLDPVAQREAERSANHTLSRLEQQKDVAELQTAVVISDRETGAVRALLGDRNSRYAGFNRALNSSRSIGSMVKPAVFLTGYEQGYGLHSILDDEPLKIEMKKGEHWQPRNYDREFRGMVPAGEALSRSLNVPTVNLGMDVGLDRVIDNLHKLGVDKVDNQYPSLLLGAINLSPFQVAQMYQTLSRQGESLPLHSLQLVQSEEGEILYRSHHEARRVLDEKASYLTLYNMQQVTRNGTARRLAHSFPKVSLAGKTGTTDALRDSWYVGIDGQEVVTVWIGRDDNQSSALTGTSGAMTLYEEYKRNRQPQSLALNEPQGVQWAWFDPVNGNAMKKECSDSLEYLPYTGEVKPRGCITNIFRSIFKVN